MKKEIQEFVGKDATIEVNGLTVNVKILDVKNSYGNIRYQITPVSGSGETWTEKIKLNK